MDDPSLPIINVNVQKYEMRERVRLNRSRHKEGKKNPEKKTPTSTSTLNLLLGIARSRRNMHDGLDLAETSQISEKDETQFSRHPGRSFKLPQPYDTFYAACRGEDVFIVLPSFLSLAVFSYPVLENFDDFFPRKSRPLRPLSHAFSQARIW